MLNARVLPEFSFPDRLLGQERFLTHMVDRVRNLIAKEFTTNQKKNTLIKKL